MARGVGFFFIATPTGSYLDRQNYSDRNLACGLHVTGGGGYYYLPEGVVWPLATPTQSCFHCQEPIRLKLVLLPPCDREECYYLPMGAI